jgi:hypothetical protein
MSRARVRLLLVALLALAAGPLAKRGEAHVGSPDAWYEGPAGPYRVCSSTWPRRG